MDAVESQDSIKNEHVKDLPPKPPALEGDQQLLENEVAHSKNTNVNGVNGSTPQIDTKPQVADASLPTPTDSAVDAPALPLNGISAAQTQATAPGVAATDTSVAEATATPAATTTSAPAETAETAAQTSTATDATPKTITSAQKVEDSLTDPAVQQPVSESRDPIEPATQEQAAEIKAQRERANEAKDNELAQAVGEGSNVPAERQPTPPTPPQAVSAAKTRAVAEGDPMDTSTAESKTPAEPVDLPHRSPAPPTIAEKQAEASEAAPVTSASVEKQADPDAMETDDVPVKAPESASPAQSNAPAAPSTTLPNPSLDTEMKDVPPSPGKIPRSRDDDDGGIEEPDAKRMRPSSSGTGVAAPTTAGSVGSPANAGSPASPAAAMGDRDFQSPITEPQYKAIALVIANTKRSTHATAFSKAVDPVVLGIPTYYNVVTQPMDLGTMNEKIKNREYPTVQSVVDDFNLIITNTEKFNGPTHLVTQNGYKLRDTFEKQMHKVPSADFVEPPPAEKKKTPTARSSGSRRESRAAAAPPPPPPPKPVAASPQSQTFALGPEGVPLIRRDSGAQDGRPRREIHPPAPKDLPYSQRPKKKKYQVELRYCADVLKEFEKPKYAHMAGPFKTPVDPVALNIPNYHKIIKKPMDLSTMRKKLDGGMYENAKEFEQDVRLMFQNCYKFNPEGDFVNICGKQLEGEFNAIWAEKDAWVKKRQQDAGQQSPGSSPEADSEAEEEEEEEEEEEDRSGDRIAALEAAIQAHKQSYEQQLQDMAQELSTLKKQPKKKKKATPPASGKKKGGKKDAGGSSKKGASGKESGKKSKKGGKKSDSTPYVTYAEKQDISNRINTLPENRMAQALNIIRDNMPNLKGVQEDELELDIDELSNEVLYKLLQFVKKYAPKPEDEPSESRRQSFAPATSSKPKKNKPMGAREQENRIAELKRLQAGGMDGGPANAESSDDEEDDDSDEESEED